MKLEFETNFFFRDDSDAIRCPGCGECYVHPIVDGIEVHTTDGYTCPLETRGDWLAVPFWCEMCKDTQEPVFRLVVGFHKGQTFVGTVT